MGGEMPAAEEPARTYPQRLLKQLHLLKKNLLPPEGGEEAPDTKKNFKKL
jgi:hypothetical protein